MAHGIRSSFLGIAFLAAGMAGLFWMGSGVASAADKQAPSRSGVSARPATSQTVATAPPSASSRGKRPTASSSTSSAPETPPVPMPKETTLTEDPKANVIALQREKLELLRQREDLLRRAMAANQATQAQVDDASLDALRLEVELQDRPPLRLIAMEKIVEIRKRIEDEAESALSTKQPKGNDARNVVAAHGRYVQARLRRINAQIDLEQERAAQGLPSKSQ